MGKDRAIVQAIELSQHVCGEGGFLLDKGVLVVRQSHQGIKRVVVLTTCCNACQQGFLVGTGQLLLSLD